MKDHQLKTVINDFMESIYCSNNFPYPFTDKSLDIHINTKIKLKEEEIEELEEKKKNYID